MLWRARGIDERRAEHTREEQKVQDIENRRLHRKKNGHEPPEKKRCAHDGKEIKAPRRTNRIRRYNE